MSSSTGTMKYAEFSEMTTNGTSVDHEDINPVLTAKLASMVVLGVCSFLLGILPIKLSTWLRWTKPKSTVHLHHSNEKQPLVISLLLCFGAGVLLYTVFMHLQPEVVEQMDQIIHDGGLPEALVDSGLNLAQLIFCVGFFAVYFIEEVVHLLLDKKDSPEDFKVLHRTLSMRKNCANPGGLIPRITLGKPASSPASITASTQVLIRDPPYAKHNPIDPLGSITPLPTDPSDNGSTTASDSATTVAKTFRGFLAVVALSFHAVFEGLAVGLEKDAASVWYLCAAIATHKLVIAFCLGVELVSSRTKTFLIVLYMASFAVVSPLGIGIGVLISSDSSNSTQTLALPSVILQGIASGTLLYVVFFEVLKREKTTHCHGFLQLLAIIAGFAVMITLSLFIGHNHSHSHGGLPHEHDHDHDHTHNHDHR